VVTVNGERVGFKEIFIRWIFRGDFIWISADLLVLIWFAFGILGFVVCSTSKRRQRMGDAMANALVIKNKSSVNYQLSDVLAIKNSESYVPVYSAVVRFTDEDMLLIKSTLSRVQLYPNDETKKFTIELATRTAELIGLSETPAKKIEFLKTVLQDYVVLTR